MKKGIIIFIIGFIAVLAGCGSEKHTLDIKIDQFIVPIETLQEYKQIPTANIQSNFKNELYQVYTAGNTETQTGEISSIFITKSDILDQTRDTRKDTNLKTLKEQFTNTQEIKIKEINITCGDKEEILSGMIVTLDQTPIYISQLWRKQNNNGYIMSTLTKEEKEQSLFTKSFKNIMCQK